jgi:hypothetical protein
MSLRCPIDGLMIVSRWFAFAVIATTAGCGKSKPEQVPVFPVNGAVTFDGRATPGAMIVLHAKSGASANMPTPRAQVEGDGSFRFTTYKTGDGVPSGDYVATIAWYKLVGKPGDYQAGPNVLPPKYANPKTSSWEIRVADQAAQLPPVQLRR